MEEEAAKLARYGLKMEHFQIVPEVWVHDDLRNPDMLDDVGQDGGENTIVFYWVLEQIQLHLEVTHLFDSPLNEPEPVYGGEPDDGV